ncbi:MAG: hypothetical protein U0K57_10030 [Lachnospiraceae bacterium]|nr:hypothetical protein [Lachnospiraceae bacterium]
MIENSQHPFTPAMAVIDMIPVLLFCASTVVMVGRTGNVLVTVGGILVILAGMMKAVWKLICTFSKKDIPLLSKQLRVFMPIGFVALLIGLIQKSMTLGGQTVILRLLQLPAVLFLLLMMILVLLLGFLAVKGDRDIAIVTWIEEIVNIAAQASFLLLVISY